MHDKNKEIKKELFGEEKQIKKKNKTNQENSIRDKVIDDDPDSDNSRLCNSSLVYRDALKLHDKIGRNLFLTGKKKLKKKIDIVVVYFV